MAYRPQENGTEEIMVKTLTRDLKMHVTDTNPKNWDEYAKRLTFAINTVQDRVQKILHSTLSTVLTHDRRWKRLCHWKAPNDGVRNHEDGVTIYNVNTSGREKSSTIVYRLRSRIGPIDTTLRKHLIRYRLDRKYGSIWIG